MNTLTEAIELFLRRKRPNTQRAYRHALMGLELSSGKPLEKVLPIDIMRYLDRKAETICRDGTPTAIATVKRHFHTIRSAYNYLVDMQLIPHNPAKAAGRAISWRQAEMKRPTASLEWAVTRKALRAEITRHPKKTILYRGMLALLFGAGLRRSEALSLNLEDIKISPWGRVFIELKHTKSGKPQMRFLSKFAWKYLSLLVSQRKAEFATDSDPLLVFYYKDGRVRERISEKTLYMIFRRVMTEIGVKAAPHSARASLATKLKRMGLEDRLVADVLGHASEKMVRVYDKRKMTLKNNPLRYVEL